MSRRRRFPAPSLAVVIGLLALCCWCTSAHAADKFPPLDNNPVIDNANSLTPTVRDQVDAQLKDYATRTTNQ